MLPPIDFSIIIDIILIMTKIDDNKTPWEGDPRVNIQNAKGKAKTYQVKQVLLAIEKLEVNHDTKK